MTKAMVPQSHFGPNGMADPLATLIDAIGHEHFGSALVGFLHRVCGAERFHAFRLGNDQPHSVVAGCVQPGQTDVGSIDRYLTEGLWRKDVVLDEAQRSVCGRASSVVHADLGNQGVRDHCLLVFPQLSDRVVLCGRSSNGSFGLNILRTRPQAPFSRDAVRKLNEAANMVVISLAKHAAMVQAHNLAKPFAVLPAIENCIAATGELPRREGEVCARILYGMGSAGIAIDLAISEETIKTYRKRAYQRLSIGSERELLNWYLQRRITEERRA